MELFQLYANTSRKQILVYVNGLLQNEGPDYEWDSIDEVPVFKSELYDKDLVSVVTVDFVSGCVRKDYKVENPGKPKSYSGDINIIAGSASDDGGGITITAQDVSNSYLTIGEEDCTGGDVLITAGEGYAGAESGEVIIRSGKAIHLDAPNVIVGPKEEKWPTSLTSESD